MWLCSYYYTFPLIESHIFSYVMSHNIYNILSDLLKSPIVNKVYGEGLSVNTWTRPQLPREARVIDMAQGEHGTGMNIWRQIDFTFIRRFVLSQALYLPLIAAGFLHKALEETEQLALHTEKINK